MKYSLIFMFAINSESEIKITRFMASYFFLDEANKLNKHYFLFNKKIIWIYQINISIFTLKIPFDFYFLIIKYLIKIITLTAEKITKLT